MYLATRTRDQPPFFDGILPSVLSMASNAQGFVIEGGRFNEVQNQNVDHSTNYQLNISLTSEVLHSKAGASANDFGSLLNREALISQANLLVGPVKSSSSLTSEGSERSMSSSTPSINVSTVNGPGAIERPVAVPIPEPQVKVIQEVEKRLAIYTGVDKALKKLNRSISIVLTLTPAMTHEFDTPWATIVWKVLIFEKIATMRRQIDWTSRTGFCTVEELDDGTLQPGDLRSVVTPGTATILQTVEGDEEFSQQMEVPSDEMRGVCNLTGFEQRLALCSIDPKKPKSNQFSPVVDLAVGEFFACGPPVMLQAFAVPPSEYQERQPIDTRTLLRPLFVSAGTSAPEPIDISKLSKSHSSVFTLIHLVK